MSNLMDSHIILHWKGPVTGSVGEKLIRQQLDLGLSLLFLWGFLEAL